MAKGKKLIEAIELLARKIDKINHTDNFPDNTLDEIRELLYKESEPK